MANPIVTIKQGQLKGRIGVDYKGGNFYSFQGIPYGKPPVGELRFKAPLPADSWDGVRDALVEGSESVSKHMIFFTNIGTEDCLSLNVYTPQLPSGSSSVQKPVMVWIHGGGFTAGSNKAEIYGPEFLVSQDVVLVSINYRLGILGFLKMEDPSLEVYGNAGLKDMVLALKWVQNNIKQFGGDPNNVTIFGESAGSAAVHYLVLSPKGKGLFHRAIMQSGSALNPWAYGENNAFEVAKALGYEGTIEKDVLKFLQSMPQERFLEAQEKITDPFCADVVRPFGPSIEKPHPDAFLTESPLDIMTSGKFNKVPFMIGYTTREGMLMEFMQKKIFGKIVYPLSDFEKSVPEYYKVTKSTELSKSIGNKIKEFYYGNSDPQTADIDKFYLLQSDVFFCRGIHVATKLMLRNTNAPIYFYRFSVETELNLYKKIMNITSPGVSHADDLGYLFKSIVTPEISENSSEAKAVHRMLKFWSTFARNGDPNPNEKDPLIDIKWPAIKDQFEFLDIGEKLVVGTHPDNERMEFWNKVSSTPGINSKL